jgi:hypothetical protein
MALTVGYITPGDLPEQSRPELKASDGRTGFEGDVTKIAGHVEPRARNLVYSINRLPTDEESGVSIEVVGVSCPHAVRGRLVAP